MRRIREVKEKNHQNISTYDDNDDKKEFVVAFIYTLVGECTARAKGNASDSRSLLRNDIFLRSKSFLWIHRRRLYHKKDFFYHDVGDKEHERWSWLCWNVF